MYFISLSALKKSTTRFQQNELRGACRSFSPEKRRSEPKHVDRSQTDSELALRGAADTQAAGGGGVRALAASHGAGTRRGRRSDAR